MLDIRPLLWKDGWPVAGVNMKEGTYEIESQRTGTSLELAVEGVPVGGPRGGRGARAPGGPGGAAAPGGGGMFGGASTPVPNQDPSQVSTNWPAGNVPARMANYLVQAQQQWAIAPAPNGGGYPGSPYFKITIAGTDRTLSATENAELVVLPAFTGAPEQLWRFDQLADGTWRISPKSVPNSKETLALTAIGASFATLERFDPSSDKQHWLVKLP